MGSYTQYITNSGDNMIALALSGGVLKFTRVVISDQAISGTVDQIKAITGINEIRKEVAPDAATVSEREIRVQSAFSNEDVTRAYLVQVVGVYARIENRSEELFGIAIATEPSKMIVPSATSINTLEFNFNMKVQQAEQITITVEQGGYLPSDVFYNTLYRLTDQSLLQQAFYDVFAYLEQPESQAMSSVDILRAINTEWGGESSDDPNALSAAEVTAALNSEWNGETSSDPNALSAAQISEILTTPEGAQLSAAEIAARL